MTEPDWALLEAAWIPARAAGVLGGDTIEELFAHAVGFLPAACAVSDTFVGVDLGTGAGVPGLLLALARPASRWLLVDSSAKRCELADAAVQAMHIGDRVSVRHARAEEIAHDEGWRRIVDLVVARSFGAPAEIAECGLPLLAPDGALVVSVTEETAALWERGLRGPLSFVSADVRRLEAGRYLTATLEPGQDVPETWPRRPPARARRPLF